MVLPTQVVVVAVGIANTGVSQLWIVRVPGLQSKGLQSAPCPQPAAHSTLGQGIGQLEKAEARVHRLQRLPLGNFTMAFRSPS